ncbi:hypothetical protein CCAX7_002170 [Capsulimonas corticalis]|uniref:Uncharacterized protein n=1 Tax=Capsulimonas corticalis TaxID=2219043 RepID=A0A402CS27_9BACT|nr:DUF1343 domain-containing protein [Capsulimonas corticalis]BDI28166.1 hypothetical protein CCAX7_002170 [Capsulimonas corticalis]
MSNLKSVLAGVDVLERDGFSALAGSRVALVTNHTGLTGDGRATADLLRAAPSVDLRALFGPEHGVRGELDTEQIADGVDRRTGLPVYSLYGPRTRPSEEQLAEIDTLVFDIQDIGCRFYTYISTLAQVMDAAAEFQKRLIVLDRPNPIQGAAVEGPIADVDKLAFVACHPIPVRHGVTIGEMGRLLQKERVPGCDLTVVPCEGWRRNDWWDATGLVWTNPSPNMRSLTQAVLYPGVGLLEMTNVSVGRGTDTPFELFGAPYLEPRAFAAFVNDAALPGVRAVPVWFTPRASVFAGERCGGVNLALTDRGAFDAVRLGFTLAAALRSLAPDLWIPEKLMTLLVNSDAYRGILEDRPYETIASGWRNSLTQFAARRDAVLLYP